MEGEAEEDKVQREVVEDGVSFFLKVPVKAVSKKA